ncbi:hypothetical protein [uncultured Clostridium sp.]|uniref:hypothetical protein n=1 Tax=uncultured Clostridium sp. TaxID=59620 RepID=UPI0026301281|nr:hypothetical protein [uncultured Clostridium sp.]
MEKKELVLKSIDKALELIKNLSEEDLLALAKDEKSFILEVKTKLEVDEGIDTRQQTGAVKKGIYNEGRNTTKKSEYESNKNEKENKVKKEVNNQSPFKKIINEPINEFDIYIRELSRFRSKEEATKYLLDNKLTVTKLKILAKKLSIYIKSKSKKIDIVEAIVEGIVGSMLKLEALREY